MRSASSASALPCRRGDYIYGYVERIEQCGNRIVDAGGGTIADARADGSEENGVHDVSAFDFETPIHVIATSRRACSCCGPRTSRSSRSRAGSTPTAHLVWHRPDLGDRLVTLERIGGPCEKPPGTAWARMTRRSRWPHPTLGSGRCRSSPRSSAGCDRGVPRVGGRGRPWTLARAGVLFREVLAQGSVPLVDHFAYTPTVVPSVHHEWGAGAIAYALVAGSARRNRGIALRAVIRARRVVLDGEIEPSRWASPVLLQRPCSR
jgi:hypothetical protein